MSFMYPDPTHFLSPCIYLPSAPVLPSEIKQKSREERGKEKGGK